MQKKLNCKKKSPLSKWYYLCLYCMYELDNHAKF